jgi:cell division septation protein DedD
MDLKNISANYHPSYAQGLKGKEEPTESKGINANYHPSYAQGLKAQKVEKPLPTEDKVTLTKSSASAKTKPTPKPADGKLEQEPVARKKWNILIYLGADNNLEEFEVNNVIDMEKVGSDANTNIIAQLDRGPNPSSASGGWANCKRFYITKDSDHNNINSKVIKDLGNIDSADPNKLKDFIVETSKEYPAEHTLLIINNHGAGFLGAVSDDTSGNFMSLPQIRQALEDAEKATGSKIDVVGFDACLMGQTEVGYELKDAANYLLASEETEGGPGWPYNRVINDKVLKKIQSFIKKQANQKLVSSPDDFCKHVVKVLAEVNSDIPTFSATDLSKMPEVAKASSDLAEKMIKATADKATLRSIISATQHFGGSYTPYKDFRDEYDLAKRIASDSRIKDPELKAAAQKVLEAVNNAVIAEEHSSGYPNSHGLSVYLPTYAGAGPKYGYQDTKFAQDTQWDEGIAALGKGATPPEEKDEFSFPGDPTHVHKPKSSKK